MVCWAICGTDVPAACSSTQGDEAGIGRGGMRGEPYLELLLLSGILGQLWTDTERSTRYLQFTFSLL